MQLHSTRHVVLVAAALLVAGLVTAGVAAKSIVTRGSGQEGPPSQGQYPNQYPQQPQGQPSNPQADPTRNMTPDQRARWCRDHPGYC